MGKWLLMPECFTLIKNLQYAEELSFINLSIIKYSLTSINHFELLQECLKLRSQLLSSSNVFLNLNMSAVSARELVRCLLMITLTS